MASLTLHELYPPAGEFKIVRGCCTVGFKRKRNNVKRCFLKLKLGVWP
jgi:hypothetical protein